MEQMPIGIQNKMLNDLYHGKGLTLVLPRIVTIRKRKVRKGKKGICLYVETNIFARNKKQTMGKIFIDKVPETMMKS